jgi:hypothetical protein
MTDTDDEFTDLRAQWDTATHTDALRPTAAETAAMRAHVLETITTGKTARARRGVLAPRWRWAAVTSLAAAAALVVLVARRDVPDIVVDLEGVNSASMRTALTLASREASPEFAVLDAAALELDDALRRTPDDAELRRFRAALDARRDELAHRIRSVTE